MAVLEYFQLHLSNMRILYDGRVFQMQKAGGVNDSDVQSASGLHRWSVSTFTILAVLRM
jgi:hypothetical protein